jgi:outer membrane receptor for ferrienterochelin and colicins
MKTWKQKYSHHGQVSASYQVYEERTNYLQFIATGFYNDVYNGIVLVSKDTLAVDYTYMNAAHQRNAIGTIQADGQYNNLHFQLGYSYTHLMKLPDPRILKYATELTASLQYAWRKAGLNFNAFYKFTGEQAFLQVGIDGSLMYNGTQNPYSTLDASIEKKFSDNRIQLIAGMKNILNITQLRTTTVASGSHGGGMSAGFLPRSIYTSLRLSLSK